MRTYFLPTIRVQGEHAPSSLQVCANAAMKIDACFFPLALDGSFRDISNRGDFRERKAAKELQVHDFSEGRLCLREFVERFADPGEFLAIHGILNCGSVRRNLELPTPLLS